MTVCCPTCGSNVERIDPAKAVASIRLGGLQERLVQRLLRNFGEYMSSEILASHVWADAADGGPLTWDASIGNLAAYAKPHLLAVGLTIEGKRGPGGGRRLTWATEKTSAA